MLNNVVLIGRLFDNVTMHHDEYDREYYDIPLAVTRSFKNEEGIYETDFIRVRGWKTIGLQVQEYTRKGDLISVKGRLQTTIGNGLVLIAEKVTFLASNPTQRMENSVDTSEEI